MALFDRSGRILLSASQINTFNNCPRYWWWMKIKKKRVAFTDALAYGSKLHSLLEKSYKLAEQGKEFNESREIIKEEKMALKKFNDMDEEILDLLEIGWQNNILTLPKKYLIEHKFKLSLEDFGIINGIVDFYNVNKGRIEDHKTTVGWQWALSAEELSENIQMMIYAYWILTKLGDRDTILLRHNQFHKLAPETSRFVETEVTREQVETYWNDEVLGVSKKILDVSQQTNEDEVPTKTSFCNNCYGKDCDFIKFCNK